MRSLHARRNPVPASFKTSFTNFLMPRIPRPIHGVLDYVTGVLLAASPWLFGFSDQHLAPQFALIFGGGAVLYSLLTNYELGVVRLFPFPVHLFIDFCSGLLLATNWVHFAFGGRAGVVFTIFGIMEIGVVLLSRRDGPMKTPSVL
jgi:hypothetical protein